MKSKKAEVYYNNIPAGFLTRSKDEYIFEYLESYFLDPSLPAISLSLPKTQKVYRSKILFPFFYGLLAEGEQKLIQSRVLKIDENDHFTRLIKTAENTIGAISLKEVK